MTTCTEAECVLLLKYDENNNGTIDSYEYDRAEEDYNWFSTISSTELAFVKRARDLGEGGIEKLCPGCTGVPVPIPVPTPGEIIIPGMEYDPCEGVVCDDVCVNADRYDQICDDGICIRGVLLEANSPICPGYIAPAAKGRIDSHSWVACHERAGCRTDIAYWGSEVTVGVAFSNIGNAAGEFKIRLTKKAPLGIVGADLLLGESAFVSVAAGASETVSVVFVMPSVSSLTAVMELIRNV